MSDLSNLSRVLERAYSDAAINKIKHLCDRLDKDVPELEGKSLNELLWIELELEADRFEKAYGRFVVTEDVDQVYIDCFYEGTA